MTTDDREQRDADMLKAWRDGQTITEIAEHFGLSLNWTGELLRQAGAVMPEHRRGVKRELDVAEIVGQYEDGMTVREIAAAHDSTYSTIYRRLQAEGVTMRPRGGTFGRNSL